MSTRMRDTVVESADREKTDTQFDDILERCCGTGLWQALLIGYMSVMWLLLPVLTLAMMFLGATPDFKCADGFAENATFTDLPDNTPRCLAFNSTAKCSRWAFDKSIYLSTVVTEWNLVCDRKPLLSLLQSWLMIGGMVSPVIVGQVSDRFGRRAVILPASLLLIVTVFAAVWSPGYSFYAVLRFLMGIGMTAILNSQIVMVMELSGIKYRAILGSVSIIPFPIGTALMAAAAYALRERWQLQLAYAVPFLLFLPNIWLMPESPRWLVHHGKFDEAYMVLKKAAAWNKKQMPAEQEVKQMMTEARDAMLAREAASRSAIRTGILQQFLRLVRTPRMRRYTIISVFLGFSVSGSFYGIAFDITQLSSSPHLAGILNGVVSLPSYLIFPLLMRLGRRISIAFFFSGAAVSMMIILVKQDATLWLAFGLTAQLCAAAAFVTMDVYVNEFMPTQLRGLAFGICHTAMRTGSTVSPFVVNLVSEIDPAAPSAVFAVFLVISAAASLFLPETKGRPMPENVADVEQEHAPVNEGKAHSNFALETNNDS